MATINYAYAVGQLVYHMTSSSGIREAVVRAVTSNVNQSGATLSYDIAFTKPSEGSQIVTEPTLFADVDAALAAYRPTILTSQ